MNNEFDMSDKSEIPCSICQNYHHSGKKDRFSCEPNKCQRLTKWLFTYTPIKSLETKLPAEDPIQYVV